MEGLNELSRQVEELQKVIESAKVNLDNTLLEAQKNVSLEDAKKIQNSNLLLKGILRKAKEGKDYSKDIKSITKIITNASNSNK